LCADSSREDLTSQGLEENNIYRVWYCLPHEEKILTSADVASLLLSCLNQLANEKP
jgi:hypothetical protein